MWKPLLAVLIAAPCFAQSPVKGVGNFIHAVADLDQSVRFYRDLLGMEMPRPPGDWQMSEGITKMYDAGGARFRVGNAQVTGVPMRVELVQFQSEDRKPVRRALGEPGASILMLTVADLQPVLDRVKAANWPLAVNVTQGCNGRGVALADPDAFPVVIVQPAVSGDAPPAPGKNVLGLRFGYTVSDDALLNGAFKALRLAGQPAPPSACQRVEEAILKTSAITTVKLPDGFELMLVHAAAGRKSAGTTRPRDPGAAVLRLPVNDAETSVRALGEAGVKVVSEGGVIQTLPPAGLRAAILGAPDNLFIQILQ